MEPKVRQTVDERIELGKSLRKKVPRTSHAEWPDFDRPDPIELIEEQNRSRLDLLVPVRRARMMQSAFAFYRVGARVMATDLPPIGTIRTPFRADCHTSC